MTPKTIEIYQTDKRFNKGEKLLKKVDVTTRKQYNAVVDSVLKAKNQRFEIHDTYVMRINLITGGQYQERYDTPFYCSPSSETYWSA